jgi:predicted transposase/invertase (TIGR01784 family)
LFPVPVHFLYLNKKYLQCGSLRKKKYINPFTDFGFKRLFGEEMNKDILIDFLNELLREQVGLITDIRYKNTEKRPRTQEERKAIFDIYCENSQGELFLIEMQKSKQAYFKDRTLYYSTFPIQ